MNKIKILLTYLVYPLAMATYFRKALEHREDVDLKVAGIYTGAWIPWMGGMTLPSKYAVPPDISLPLSLGTNEYPYELIKGQLGEWKPDLIIQVDAGFHAKYKPADGMVVTVGTDPHVLNEFYDTPRKYSDKFFNMQAVYSKQGDVYLPYAYSKYDVYPEDIPNPDDTVDAALIGMPYENRVQWVQELRNRGMKVIFENGPVFDEARELYNRGRIGLNWSSMDDLNCRAFELPAMKLCPVMNYVPDMQRFFEPDEDYLQFTTMREAIEKTMWAKLNPDLASAMAERAYQKVLPHTYDQRVTDILKETGFVL
jgi:hypothetical protein